MAVNYGNLKKSETELIQKFYEYLDHTYQMHRTVLKALEEFQNPQQLKTEIQKIYELEKISNITQADLLDECTWIISKDQPRASHLRFVIAIINSINDLERICDYANNIAKFLERSTNSLDPGAIELVKELESIAVDSYHKIFNHFREHDANETYKYAEELQETFSTAYIEKFKEIRSTYIKNAVNMTDDESKFFVNLILAFKNVERILDHVTNIIEYFIYIKESNFFFKKRNY